MRLIAVFVVATSLLAGAQGPAPDHWVGTPKRAAVNAWLRGKTAGFDGVIDFDAVTKDPAHATQIAPTLHVGDHLHPNDAGYNTMANAIDLKLFAR